MDPNISRLYLLCSLVAKVMPVLVLSTVFHHHPLYYKVMDYYYIHLSIIIEGINCFTCCDITPSVSPVIISKIPNDWVMGTE
jgi:hypothetical protein